MLDISPLTARIEAFTATLSSGQIYMMLGIGVGLIVLSLLAIAFQTQRGIHIDPATLDVNGKHKKGRAARNGQILARFDQISVSRS